MHDEFIEQDVLPSCFVMTVQTISVRLFTATHNHGIQLTFAHMHNCPLEVVPAAGLSPGRAVIYMICMYTAMFKSRIIEQGPGGTLESSRIFAPR